MDYKQDILKGLEERIINEYDYKEEGILKRMVSPALYTNSTLSVFLNNVDVILVESILDIKRTQNLYKPSVNENDV